MITEVTKLHTDTFKRIVLKIVIKMIKEVPNIIDLFNFSPISLNFFNKYS